MTGREWTPEMLDYEPPETPEEAERVVRRLFQEITDLEEPDVGGTSEVRLVRFWIFNRCPNTLAKERCSMPDPRCPECRTRADAELAERLAVENESLRAEVAALGEWACGGCGARFPETPPVKRSLEGVTHCSRCVEIEVLRAELAHVADVAGEALGTDPELRTAVGGVEALAGWCKSLQEQLEDERAGHAMAVAGLTSRSGRAAYERLTRERNEAQAQVAELRARLGES